MPNGMRGGASPGVKLFLIVVCAAVAYLVSMIAYRYLSNGPFSDIKSDVVPADVQLIKEAFGVQAAMTHAKIMDTFTSRPWLTDLSLVGALLSILWLAINPCLVSLAFAVVSFMAYQFFLHGSLYGSITKDGLLDTLIEKYSIIAQFIK